MKKAIKTVSLLVIAVLLVASMMIPASAESSKPSLKVLVVGQCYTVDYLTNVYSIASSQGVEISVGLIYGDDFTIADHKGYFDQNTIYGHGINGKLGNEGGYYLYDGKNPSGAKDSNVYFKEIVQKTKWDVIVLQNAIGDAGVNSSSTIKEFGEELAEECKNKNVKIMYSDIWALENGATITKPEVFNPYDGDQATMYGKIKSATDAIKASGVEVVPINEAFNIARNGELKNVALCTTDRCRANGNGKFLAALTWYQAVTGAKLDTAKIKVPSGLDSGEAIIAASEKAISEYGITLVSVEEAFNKKESDKSTDDAESTEENTAEESFPTLIVIVAAAAVVVIAVVVVVIIVVSKKKKNK